MNGVIVVNGLATINKGTDCELAANICEREGEGDGLYGGDDDTIIRYLRYAGPLRWFAFTADNERMVLVFQGLVLHDD